MNKHSPINFDHAAGTAVAEDVMHAMLPYFEGGFGNPSSLHYSGRNARHVLEKARESIASILHATPEEIFFTGSGTESDNLAVIGFARANKAYGNHILVSSIEHKAVIESAKQLEREGFIIEYIPVDKYGMIDVDDCMRRIRKETILISIMYANNEIGTIQPIKEIGAALLLYRKENKFPCFHTDACQAAGYLPVDVNTLGVDLLTLNGGKIYGPKGVGMLYVRKDTVIDPILFGGGQEQGLRPGTENLPLIVGFDKALLRVEKRREEESHRLSSLRDWCISALRAAIPSLTLNGHPSSRLPNNIHISVGGVEGESMLLMLDECGIEVATGSACSSNDLQVSHVLSAVKQDPLLSHGSLRITFGETTTKEECDYLVLTLPPIIKKLREISPLSL